MNVPRKEQFSGCLIGQCLGDALGFPVEGKSGAVCRGYVEEYLGAGRAGSLGRGSYSFGQYTDDSQLARELMQSYVERGQFDPADYARRIAAIFRERRIVGAGGAARFAAGRLNVGVPWEQAGMPPPDARNGSAMRAGPIGLLFHDDPSALIQAAHDQGRITHQDPRCSAGAVAIAGAVALALRGEMITPEPFLTQLATWTAAIEPSTPQYLQRLIEWVALPASQAAPLIAVAGQDPDSLGVEIRIPVFVTATILWSLYAFLRSPGDYWETICTAIAVGGDVDTTAAMAGAISGAYLGLEAIPTALASRLNDQGTWGYTELLGLAQAVHAISEGSRRA